ncbi:hypothetical protein GFY24_08300 [Nocardia sp. SYP-A9097]|nr:hypothetical protein [Nocardia sp. SYP-A9097]
MPSVASGGFAATFAVQAADRDLYAVRCFHKQGQSERQLRERYEHIHRFITAHPELTFLIDAVYQDDGIVVGGNGYPMVRMRWAAGEMLGVWVEDWIEDAHRDRAAIEKVRTGIGAAVAALRRAGAAHGDLQHGNIVVGQDLSISLIDYDGMYLNAFESMTLRAIEQGHRNYQHPGRGERFDLSADAFASAVIDVSLRALGQRPALWEDFGGTGENLIFSARDFVDPDNSPVFAALARMPAVADAARRLSMACRTDYDFVERVLVGGTMAVPTAGGFALAAGEVIDARNREELLARAGDTVTVYGRIRFATMTIGRSGRDIALINFGEWPKGDFTIVAYDDIARKLFADYGKALPEGKRRLSALHGWQVAITGTVVIYVNRGTSVPQIELVRAGLLRQSTDEQIAALITPPSAGPPAGQRPPTPPRAVVNKSTFPPASPATLPKPVPPQHDRSAVQAQRQARLSEMYRDFPVSPPAVQAQTPPATSPPRAVPPRQAPTTNSDFSSPYRPYGIAVPRNPTPASPPPSSRLSHGAPRSAPGPAPYSSSQPKSSPTPILKPSHPVQTPPLRRDPWGDVPPRGRVPWWSLLAIATLVIVLLAVVGVWLH